MEKEKYKVSIIIPIYNDEKYLERCLDSIINQTYKNIEIIAINDGSKDNSKVILDKYEKEYPEIIKHIEQKNQGIAKTRNNGIKYATGEYLMFMDDDDYFDDDYIKTYLEKIIEDDFDVVVGGYKRPDENGNMVRKFELEQTPWCKIVLCTPWAKIYKTEYIRKNGFEFLDNNIGEDLYFNIQALLYSNKVKITDYIGYNWFFNTKSVSNTLHKNIENVDIYKLLNSMYDAVRNNGILEKEYNMVEAYFIVTAIYILTSTTKKVKLNIISREYDKLFKWISEKFPNFTKNKIVVKDKLKGDPNSLKIRLFLKLYKIKLGKILIYLYSII